MQRGWSVDNVVVLSERSLDPLPIDLRGRSQKERSRVVPGKAQDRPRLERQTHDVAVPQPEDHPSAPTGWRGGQPIASEGPGPERRAGVRRVGRDGPFDPGHDQDTVTHDG